jgi:hypothetical protein
LHKSDRIFAGGRERYLHGVSRPLRGRGCTPGNHGHRADLLLCAQGRGRECEVAGMQWSEDVDRPCRSERLSWSSSRRPSSRRVAGLLNAGRGDGIASRVWAWACVRTGSMAPGHVVPLGITGTTGTTGTASTAWRQRSRTPEFPGDWIGDEVLQTNRLRQACHLTGPLHFALQKVA